MGAGGGSVKSVNNERAFIVGRDAFGDNTGIVVKEGGGVLAEVARGAEEVAVFIAKADAIVTVIESEALNVGDEPQVIDAEKDGIDKMAGSVISFEYVDFIIVYIGGMAWNGGGRPLWLSEDRGFRAHGVTAKDDGFFCIGEEGIPGCDNQFSV